MIGNAHQSKTPSETVKFRRHLPRSVLGGVGVCISDRPTVEVHFRQPDHRGGNGRDFHKDVLKEEV